MESVYDKMKAELREQFKDMQMTLKQCETADDGLYVLSCVCLLSNSNAQRFPYFGFRTDIRTTALDGNESSGAPSRTTGGYHVHSTKQCISNGPNGAPSGRGGF